MRLESSLGAFYSSLKSNSENTLAVHKDLEDFYPTTGQAAEALEHLNLPSTPFMNATLNFSPHVDTLKALFDDAITEIKAKLDSLKRAASDRIIARQEIDHYSQKGVTDSAKQK